MNSDEISAIAHADHPIKAPLDDEAVRLLLDRALPRGDERVLDLGCGTAEWLLRALEAEPGVRAEGVDISAGSLATAAAEAERRGVRDRLTLHECAAADFAPGHGFDLVVSVGATHAFGGLHATLAAAGEHLAPGGRLLIGDAYWERPPSREALQIFGDGYADLATTVDGMVAEGWTPVGGHLSTRGELDAYEWACWGSLAAWGLDHLDGPDGAKVLEVANERREEWLRGYRDCFGFFTLALRPTAGRARTPRA